MPNLALIKNKIRQDYYVMRIGVFGFSYCNEKLQMFKNIGEEF